MEIFWSGFYFKKHLDQQKQNEIQYKEDIFNNRLKCKYKTNTSFYYSSKNQSRNINTN